MIELRESETVEFKKSTSEIKQGLISLSSMLNKHRRGVLYFGVKNDGSVCGVPFIGQDTIRDISIEIKNYIRPSVVPSISVLNVDNKYDVIKVEVNGDDVPYSAYSRYYIRSSDEDLIMDNKQLEQLFVNKRLDYSLWEKETSGYTIDDIDEDLLIKYVFKANQENRISFNYKDSMDSLVKLNLIKDGFLNNAGYYLFSNKKPLTLKLAIYNSDARIGFIDNRIFKGNIFECIEEAYSYIASNIRWKSDIAGLERKERCEIPLVAIREIVVNSFAHMKIDSSGITNLIYITPSKIHIYNPGVLINGFSPTDFASNRVGPIARNPLINTVLYLNKTLEEFGTGFNRVFSSCKEENIEYSYGNDPFGFYFEFKRNLNFNDGFNSNDKFNKNKKKKDNLTDILNLMKQDSSITTNEISNRLLISNITVARGIAKLKSEGKIERIGSNKTGSWKVKL